LKKYKNIREHYSRTSYTPPYASEAADDLDINLGVLDEECISRINAYLQQQTASYINPNNALNKIQRRLSTIGLVFTFPKERPYVRTESNISITSESFPISYMGGRTGVLDANYNIGTDDNIRWRTGYGLNLTVQYTLPSDGGLVTVVPRIEMVAGVTESLTTKSPKDQLKSTVRHYDRLMKKRYSKIGRDELEKNKNEPNKSDIAYNTVSDIKNATYDKLRLAKAHPENDTHRKLANLETKVARKRIKNANYERGKSRGNRKK